MKLELPKEWFDKNIHEDDSVVEIGYGNLPDITELLTEPVKETK